MPTPCSPVIDPPASTQYRKISSPAARARSISPGLRASNRIMGCMLPSPAWKILLIVSPYLRAVSLMKCSVGAIFVRGTTPSCT